MPGFFLLTEIKEEGKHGGEEECVPMLRGNLKEEGKGGRKEDKGAGHLREMNLGAPQGHILFLFEAPDKSNATECIIR